MFRKYSDSLNCGTQPTTFDVIISDKQTFLAEFSQDGTVQIEKDQSLLDAALAAGIPMMHECGGQAHCSTCRVLVLEGADCLSVPNEAELFMREALDFPANTRLACQTTVVGGCPKVSRIIRDESDINLYVGEDGGDLQQQMGSEKELVLFFLDIRNFTVILESLLPFDAIHIVRKLLTAFNEIIEKFGGRVIETAGDSVYAVFGQTPHLLPESAGGSVKAGFAIFETLLKMNKEYFETYFAKNITVGIGIHEGKAIGGTIRLGRENRLVVMGYPVNIASRLQDATKELNNSFIISDELYQLLPEPLPDHETMIVHLRGVSRPMLVHLIGKPYA